MTRGKKAALWLRRAKIVAVNLLVLGALLSLVELSFYTAIRMPGLLSLCPERVRDAVKVMYWVFDTNNVQYDRSCAMYDPRLAYTLRPGSCTFTNPEFKTVVTANSRGFRSPEKSLDRPAVIVAGDSQAMGWGVEDRETYAFLLEQTLHESVLDTGVSSYGTVREMTASAPFFSPRLKALVIQYSDNDYNENLTFAETGRLPIMDRAEYEGLVAKNQRASSYKPFQYLGFSLFTMRLWGAYEKNEVLAPSAEKQAELFVNALAPYEKDLEGVRLVVFEVGAYNKPTDTIKGLGRMKAKDPSRPLFRKMTLIDLAPKLSRQDFYLLDGHLNRQGHAKVAAIIARALAEPPR
ncbi:MAG: hypothetical protein AB1921_18185 [Thermodesulfobacteriota bacterium]